MCNACAKTLNQSSVDLFGGRLLEILNNAGTAMMLSVAHRTGLFDALDECDWATSHEIAQQANLNERYVRECLGALVTSRIVEYDPDEATYSLPQEHAALLTSRAGSDNFGSTFQWVAVLGEVESQITECFHEGGGVPYSSYTRFHEVMAEESNKTVVSALTDSIVPLCEGLKEKLQLGIRVLDVGCGSGRAMIEAAKEYPNSQFMGLDLCKETIETANRLAADAGLDNVRFEQVDVANLNGNGAFDLITAFDAIHDQAKPAVVLDNINRLLASDGTFLMQDIAASSHVDQNIDNPLAPFLYTISCMHCMSVSLAQGGDGLGAVWGKELATTMLEEAGFGNVEVKTSEHDVMNFYYIAQKR